ncbi:MAG: shikimate kinase [Nitrospiria bacterium]
MGKNIVLLGFMGTGKSIIGRRLAVELQYRFIDTDRLIEERCKKSIPEIFLDEGEPYFRKLESEVVSEVADLKNHVIATGGGVASNPTNLEVLEKSGVLVTLSARPEVILRRVQRRAGKRPLLKGTNPLETINRLLSEREAGYRRSAIHIDTSDIRVEESVHRIVDRVSEWVGPSV